MENLGKDVKRLRKKELDGFVINVLGEGPREREEIEKAIQKEYGARKTRSLTNALNRLQKEERITKDDSTGEYVLYTHISVTEAIENVERAVDELCEDGKRTVTLDKISEYAMVPKSWSYGQGETVTNFEDLAYAAVRKKTSELKSQEDPEKRPIMIGEENETYFDHNRGKIYSPMDAMFEKSDSLKERDRIKEEERMFERVMKRVISEMKKDGEKESKEEVNTH